MDKTNHNSNRIQHELTPEMESKISGLFKKYATIYVIGSMSFIIILLAFMQYSNRKALSEFEEVRNDLFSEFQKTQIQQMETIKDGYQEALQQQENEFKVTQDEFEQSRQEAKSSVEDFGKSIGF